MDQGLLKYTVFIAYVVGLLLKQLQIFEFSMKTSKVEAVFSFIYVRDLLYHFCTTDRTVEIILCDGIG